MTHYTSRQIKIIEMVKQDCFEILKENGFISHSTRLAQLSPDFACIFGVGTENEKTVTMQQMIVNRLRGIANALEAEEKS